MVIAFIEVVFFLDVIAFDNSILIYAEIMHQNWISELFLCSYWGEK